MENTKDIRDEIKFYVEQTIIPQYSRFDSAHKEDHARIVIKRALDLYEKAPEDLKGTINPELLYVAAACHDLGLAVNRETHHLESGKIIRSNSRLKDWFSEEEIEIIAQAAEDHRASNKSTPRSIYGKIVAEADRLIICDTIIERTLLFGFEHYPELSHVEHIKRALDHLEEKYGRNGYLHLCIDWSDNAEELEKLRCLMDDPQKIESIVTSKFNSLVTAYRPK